MKSKGYNNKRWLHIGIIILLGAIIFTATISLLWSNVYARGIASGAGNCGDFDNAIQLAEDNDFVPQMVPQKDSFGVVITKDLRISGGWQPTINCAENNQEFTTTAEFLNYGFQYVAPSVRSELNWSADPILTLENVNGPGYPNLDKLVIENIIFDSSGVDSGGGISGTIDGGAEVLLDNNLFFQNDVNQTGGGIHLIVKGASHLKIEDSEFEDNTSLQAGGLYIEVHDNSQLTIEGNHFNNNSSGDGGGFDIHVFDNGKVTIKDTLIEGNQSIGVNKDGGGGRIVMNGGSVSIISSTFRMNNATQYGGGLYLEMAGGNADIKNSIFQNNTASNGSGVFINSVGSADATVRVVNTQFSNNVLDHVQNGAGQLTVLLLDSNVNLPSILNGPPSNGMRAWINDITLNNDNSYSVDFSASGFVPDTSSFHVHFFFDTVFPQYAGTELCVPPATPPSDPEQCRWRLYGGPSPFTGYSFGERPFGAYGAEKMCVLVANSDHEVLLNTGNCVKLP